MVVCLSNLHKKHKNQLLCFLILCEEIFPIVFIKTEDFTFSFRMISKASSTPKKKKVGTDCVHLLPFYHILF